MAMTQLTEEQAIAFAECGAWKKLSIRDRALFQMEQKRLCMPFSEFHAAVEFVLDRPVFTHEFAYADELRKEMAGEKDPPTFEQILVLLPPEKTVIAWVNE